ncbi:MAG: hypothetical protein AB7P21_30030 [Lautropia sp.]
MTTFNKKDPNWRKKANVGAMWFLTGAVGSFLYMAGPPIEQRSVSVGVACLLALSGFLCWWTFWLEKAKSRPMLRVAAIFVGIAWAGILLGAVGDPVVAPAAAFLAAFGMATGGMVAVDRVGNHLGLGPGKIDDDDDDDGHRQTASVPQTGVPKPTTN